ncbi:hypothetical protein NDU88_007839 [Pleurodeles waltl]|uniref:Uncharacterized protein n=1 Tax=Pleurodeles waltl TaxID=8319 RepID=A0AAV7NW11_PLEWA|nr:hypothetical protein NDU88_007839 [Pleurodeles waltl]
MVVKESGKRVNGASRSRQKEVETMSVELQGSGHHLMIYCYYFPKHCDGCVNALSESIPWRPDRVPNIMLAVAQYPDPCFPRFRYRGAGAFQDFGVAVAQPAR